MSTKVLVTGASGFVGTRLLQRLTQTGTAITAVCRSVRRDQTVRRDPIDGLSPNRVNWVQADLTRDDLMRDDLRDHLRGVDTLYHLAGAFAPGYSDSCTRELRKVNVQGTSNVAKAAVEAGVGCFVHVSSVAACEQAGAPIITEENGEPNTSYGISKREGETVLREIAHGRMSYLILRPTALFGEHHLGSIYELVRAIARGMFVIIGNGRNRVNYQYIDDFVDVLLRVPHRDGLQDDVFIVADQPLCLRDVVLHSKQQLGLSPRTLRIPKFLGLSAGAACEFLSRLNKRSMPLSVRRVQAMTRDARYSCDKLRQRLPGLFPCGVHEGLERTIAWYKANALL